MCAPTKAYVVSQGQGEFVDEHRTCMPLRSATFK